MNVDYELEFEMEDAVKYKKRMWSNLSSAAKKSKHKHTYVPCMFSYYWIHPATGKRYTKYAKGEYCSICGKVNNVVFGETEKIPDSKMYRQLSDDEFYARHKDLPVMHIDTPFDKYVILGDA